jgi:hypothetical protein
MSKLPTCTKCGKVVKNGGGMLIINTNTDEENTFCNGCLKEAMHTLMMRSDKRPDEVALLQKIRTYLRAQVN